MHCHRVLVALFSLLLAMISMVISRFRLTEFVVVVVEAVVVVVVVVVLVVVVVVVVVVAVVEGLGLKIVPFPASSASAL